jgi:[FeFe] hydrogenase (group B1/B3)
MELNNTHRIRKQILIEVARLALDGDLEKEIDGVPVKMFPKQNPSMRCCVYKDRAVTKYRLMAAMGHTVENETDELKPLSEYAKEAIDRKAISGPVLTVIDTACSACHKGKYFVTNVCRGCTERSCVVNCPKNAIHIINGRSRIDDDKCVNCGKCGKSCPYHAIVYVPIPCEEACPGAAISKDEHGREQIDHEKCINCGKCINACPFAAIMGRSQIVDVVGKIKGPEKVVVMIAPAITGQFPVEFGKLTAGILEIGFDELVEVAHGADTTARQEAEELAEKLASGQKIMTSSCCPAYIQAVDKHIPEIKKYVSSTPTPMSNTARSVKEENPNAVTVFIGPCVAKRQEALDDSSVDYVLTTDELGALLVAAGIELDECSPVELPDIPYREGRGFAISGGVTDAVKAIAGSDIEVKPMLVDGLDKKSLKRLSFLAKGSQEVNFVEVMACQGGCVAGPCNIGNPKAAAFQVKKLAAESKTIASDEKE